MTRCACKKVYVFRGRTVFRYKRCDCSTLFNICDREPWKNLEFNLSNLEKNCKICTSGKKSVPREKVIGVLCRFPI